MDRQSCCALEPIWSLWSHVPHDRRRTYSSALAQTNFCSALMTLAGFFGAPLDMSAEIQVHEVVSTFPPTDTRQILRTNLTTESSNNDFPQGGFPSPDTGQPKGVKQNNQVNGLSS